MFFPKPRGTAAERQIDSIVTQTCLGLADYGKRGVKLQRIKSRLTQEATRMWSSHQRRLCLWNLQYKRRTRTKAERAISSHATTRNLVASLPCGRAANSSGVNVGAGGGPVVVGVAIAWLGKAALGPLRDGDLLLDEHPTHRLSNSRDAVYICAGPPA
jgi:hypothetical protein